MCNYKWFIEHLVFYLSGPHIHFHSYNSIKYLINLLNCLVSQLNVNICFGLACAASRAILLSAHTYIRIHTSANINYGTLTRPHICRRYVHWHKHVLYMHSHMYINIDMENQCNGNSSSRWATPCRTVGSQFVAGWKLLSTVSHVHRF